MSLHGIDWYMAPPFYIVFLKTEDSGESWETVMDSLEGASLRNEGFSEAHNLFTINSISIVMTGQRFHSFPDCLKLNF